MSNRNKQQLPAGFKPTEHNKDKEEMNTDDEEGNGETEDEVLDYASIHDLAAVKKEKFVYFADLFFEFLDYRFLNYLKMYGSLFIVAWKKLLMLIGNNELTKVWYLLSC